MQSTEQLRPEQLVGLVARSAEGTAAKGMPIKGHEDLWVEIQANTFRNWVNEHLKHAADVGSGPVLDLAEDFRDGTRLCALVEVLTKRRLPRWNPRPANQHHHLENVSTALQAIEADGVKLVNIGNVLSYFFVLFFFEISANFKYIFFSFQFVEKTFYIVTNRTSKYIIVCVYRSRDKARA